MEGMKIKGFRAWAVYNRKRGQLWRKEDGTPIISSKRLLDEKAGGHNVNVRIEARVVRVLED